MRPFICAAMLARAITTAGAADGIDGASANARLPTCKALASDKPQIANAATASYCLGMLDTLAFTSSYWDDRPWLCSDFPKGVTTQQAARVVVRYAENHPERLHEPLIWLAMQALHDAWPCKK
jgi:hypothetical protein